MPRVSVIIPTYNRAHYIAETIHSVFEQNFNDYEVIVIDDGSTDNTEEVIKPYLDKITFIRKENGGPASARNEGIKIAEGEYIAFLDSDDLWLPEKLDYQLNYMAAYRDVGLTFTDAEVISGGNNETRKIIFTGQDLSIKGLFERNFIPTLTVMVRKACIDNAGLFDESKGFIGVEDYDMWLRIAMRYRLGHIPKILARYRRHANNLMGRDLERNYINRLKIIQEFIDNYPDFPSEFQINMEEYYKNYYYRLGRKLYKHKQFDIASKYLRQALSFNTFAFKYYIAYFVNLLKWSYSARRHRKNR